MAEDPEDLLHTPAQHFPEVILPFRNCGTCARSSCTSRAGRWSICARNGSMSNDSPRFLAPQPCPWS